MLKEKLFFSHLKIQIEVTPVLQTRKVNDVLFCRAAQIL